MMIESLGTIALNASMTLAMSTFPCTLIPPGTAKAASLACTASRQASRCAGGFFLSAAVKAISAGLACEPMATSGCHCEKTAASGWIMISLWCAPIIV